MSVSTNLINEAVSNLGKAVVEGNVCFAAYVEK